MANFTVSEFAHADLEEIFLYLAERNRDASLKFVREMMKKFDLVANNPKMGVIKDTVVVGLRLFPFKNYNIFYFQTESGIEIYRILHSSRDMIQIFDKAIDDLNQ